MYHGFVRGADGTITEFDAPGAGKNGWLASLSVKAGGPPAQGTGSFSINDAGDIAGIYVDTNVVYHGFVRAANGAITEFDVPGAGTGMLQGTTGFSINDEGNIAGTFLDASNVAHGYVATGGAAPALELVAVTPCRVVDTRRADGTFGGPAISGGTSRSFPIPQGSCDIPTTAAAYSLNVTVVPNGLLGYLTIWPTGEDQPVVSTMNSLDGRIKANAAIVPAGTSEAVSVYVTNTTNVVLDIDGYFTAPGTDPSVLSADAVPGAGYPQRQRSAGRPVSEERSGARLPGTVERLQHSIQRARPTR